MLRRESKEVEINRLAKKQYESLEFPEEDKSVSINDSYIKM